MIAKIVLNGPMNIELAKTFLEIVATGSFIRASERLNVGQTTVSARIRLLEQELGRPFLSETKLAHRLRLPVSNFSGTRRCSSNFGSELCSRLRSRLGIAP
jgi:hypothetical protein